MTLPHDHRDPERAPGASELDALLDLDRDLAVPRDLAARVLGGLRDREERALDTLLAVGRDHGADAPPDGLARRVLEAVRAEEHAARQRRRLKWLPGGTLPRVAAAAAVLALAYGATRFLPLGGAPAQDERTAAGPEEAVAPELLELLPVLERWDLVTDGALDAADLDTLAAFAGEDELLVLLGTEENG